LEEPKNGYHQDLRPIAPLSEPGPKNKVTRKAAIRHSLLFVLTFASVAYTGILYVGLGGDNSTIESELWRGVTFAAMLLSFLTVHEFGHYFAAVYHKVRVSLPYFIPLPLIAIGTLGAIIRIKERITKMHVQFDIGIAGPLAGFVVSLIVLIVGFATLPGPEFIQEFGGHENTKAYVEQYGQWPDEILDKNQVGVLIVGDTLLYNFLASFFDNVPPMWEMYHFPLLFAGWLGLFFTALNLMPVGQLDGGHVLYSLIGYKKHRMVARVFYIGLTALAGVSAIPLLHDVLAEIDNIYATVSWLVWASVLLILMTPAMNKDQQW
jgi:membrane-associated protease RseP (regulator of RpoE activity)